MACIRYLWNAFRLNTVEWAPEEWHKFKNSLGTHRPFPHPQPYQKSVLNIVIQELSLSCVGEVLLWHKKLKYGPFSIYEGYVPFVYFYLYTY